MERIELKNTEINESCRISFTIPISHFHQYMRLKRKAMSKLLKFFKSRLRSDSQVHVISVGEEVGS